MKRKETGLEPIVPVPEGIRTGEVHMKPKEIFIVRNHYTGALCRDCFVDRAAAERAAATLNAGSDPYNVRYVVDSLNLMVTTQ